MVRPPLIRKAVELGTVKRFERLKVALVPITKGCEAVKEQLLNGTAKTPPATLDETVHTAETVMSPLVMLAVLPLRSKPPVLVNCRPLPLPGAVKLVLLANLTPPVPLNKA